MKPWKETKSHGFLRDHIEAQFECGDLSLMKRFTKSANPSSPLDEVREILRAIFYGQFNNSFQLFAVHGPGQNPNDDPIFFFRIHPPVRYSPHGSPLLLVSVIDYQRLEELIGQGKVDREAFQSDYHRLVTEGVSKEVCIIRASTMEELSLLRYILRVNSTKMRRSAWQSMKLPRGDDHPWIPTFISPLYTEMIDFICNRFDRLNSSSIIPQADDPLYRKSCASCFVSKVQLQLCSRCRRVLHCSISCQRNHWSMHKSRCVALSSSK